MGHIRVHHLLVWSFWVLGALSGEICRCLAHSRWFIVCWWHLWAYKRDIRWWILCHSLIGWCEVICSGIKLCFDTHAFNGDSEAFLLGIDGGRVEQASVPLIRVLLLRLSDTRAFVMWEARMERWHKVLFRFIANLGQIAFFLVVLLTDNFDFHLLGHQGSLWLNWCHKLCLMTAFLDHNIWVVHLTIFSLDILIVDLEVELVRDFLVGRVLHFLIGNSPRCQTNRLLALDIWRLDPGEDINHIASNLHLWWYLAIVYRCVLLASRGKFRRHFWVAIFLRRVFGCVFLLLLNDFHLLKLLKLLEDLLPLLGVVGDILLLANAKYMHLTILLLMISEGSGL